MHFFPHISLSAGWDMWTKGCFYAGDAIYTALLYYLFIAMANQAGILQSSPCIELADTPSLDTRITRNPKRESK